MTFADLYAERLHLAPRTHGGPRPAGGSDVVLHLPVLEWFASRCDTACEFGVRDGNSTLALLAGVGRKLWSFDVERTPFVAELGKVPLPREWEFVRLDTGDAAAAHLVPPCDLLFVDTLHTYEHVKKELALHGDKAGRYLIFHDTFTCGLFDRSGPDPAAPGILRAVEEFSAGKGYSVAYATNHGNGLLVLEKK